mgnify:CR=1 FL=1
MTKHIMVFKKAIKKEHCKNIINILDRSKLGRPPNPSVASFYNVCNANPYKQKWGPDLFNCVAAYKKKHPFLNKGVWYWEIDSHCNYQKYKPNQYYALEHCENGTKDYVRRMIGWMFYCNTIKKGGGTLFPQQKFKLKAEEGTVAIWPADWTYSHIGLVAPKEYKYIVTGWASYNF